MRKDDHIEKRLDWSDNDVEDCEGAESGNEREDTYAYHEVSCGHGYEHEDDNLQSSANYI